MMRRSQHAVTMWGYARHSHCLVSGRLLLVVAGGMLVGGEPRNAAAADPSAAACRRYGTAIVVEGNEGQLWLCQRGARVQTYAVSLGRGGLGKSKQGDQRTPQGRYALGRPRPSAEYFIFIPIGYPTEAQRKAGFTGSAIGIHGPRRWLSWGGWLNTIVNWTQGCIAVGSDQEIQAIADWVNRNKPDTVIIH